MAKAVGTEKLSDGFTGKAKKLVKVVEQLAKSPNSSFPGVVNASGADLATVSIAKKLVRRASGKNTNIDQFPSVKSRGVLRCLYKALELLGDDLEADSADVAAASGLTTRQVDALRELVGQAAATTS